MDRDWEGDEEEQRPQGENEREGGGAGTFSNLIILTLVSYCALLSREKHIAHNINRRGLMYSSHICFSYFLL